MKKTLLVIGLALALALALTLVACGGTDNGDDGTTGTAADVVKPGDVVRVNYTGKFEDGEVFDSSEGKEPLEFQVGAGMVIQGFDEAMVGMKVGESKTVTIPPEKGYGFEDYGPIPGGSTLIFEITLVEIVPSP